MEHTDWRVSGLTSSVLSLCKWEQANTDEPPEASEKTNVVWLSVGVWSELEGSGEGEDKDSRCLEF